MKIASEVKISDNGFIFNSRTGDSFSLNPTGLELIKFISAQADLGDIKTHFLNEYETDELTFEKDFYEFTALLKHHQIMEQDDPLQFD